MKKIAPSVHQATRHEARVEIERLMGPALSTVACRGGAPDSAVRRPLHAYGHPGACGFDYMHARYYNPNIARFLSVDPGRDDNLKVPQSWNLYAYARGNPIRYVDPDGREIEEATLYQASRMQIAEVSGDEALARFDSGMAASGGVAVGLLAGGAGALSAGPLASRILQLATTWVLTGRAADTINTIGGAAAPGPTPLTRGLVVEGFTVGNHAWRKGGLGKGATKELLEATIQGAREAGTVATEVSRHAKYAGNTVAQYTHKGTVVVVDLTRKLIMSVKSVDPEKFKVTQ